MTASVVKAALIGTGKISEEHLRFLGKREGVSIVGVCDLSPSLARYAAARFGAQRAFTDYRAMLRDARPDVVHVLTPPHTHVALVTDCLRAGAHVVVEKPAAPTVAEAEELWAAAETAGRLLVENHNYRFNGPVRRMEELVRSGRIGEVREVEVRMTLGIRAKGGRYADTNLPHPSHNLPAGVLHEFLTHLAYLTLMFAPGHDRVSAMWSNHGGGRLFRFDDLDAVLIGGPVHARMRFTCHQGPDCFCVTVRGTKGWASTDLFQPHLLVNEPRRVGTLLSPLANQVSGGVALARAGVRGFVAKVMQVTPYEGLATYLALVYDAVQRGAAVPVSREQSLAAARLIETLLRGREAA